MASGGTVKVTETSAVSPGARVNTGEHDVPHRAGNERVRDFEGIADATGVRQVMEMHEIKARHTAGYAGRREQDIGVRRPLVSPHVVTLS